jgi:hypothetical protein
MQLREKWNATDVISFSSGRGPVRAGESDNFWKHWRTALGN